MAHFAELDNYNIVQRVVVVSNKDTQNSQGQEDEGQGQAFCKKLFGGNNWRQTSFNGTIRKNFAGIGFRYDPLRDAFIPPRPYLSWKLNEQTCQWEPPVEYPNDGNVYVWDETTIGWFKLAGN